MPSVHILSFSFFLFYHILRCFATGFSDLTGSWGKREKKNRTEKKDTDGSGDIPIGNSETGGGLKCGADQSQGNRPQNQMCNYTGNSRMGQTGDEEGKKIQMVIFYKGNDLTDNGDTGKGDKDAAKGKSGEYIILSALETSLRYFQKSIDQRCYYCGVREGRKLLTEKIHPTGGGEEGGDST